MHKQGLRQTFLSTWRALLLPRRAVPIVIVAVPLVVAQWFFGGGLVEVLLSLGTAVVFWAVGPALWRYLFPSSGLPPPLSALVRLLLFAIAAVGCVSLFGVFGARLLSVQHSFLTSQVSLVISTALFVVGGFGLGRDIELELSLEHAQQRARLMAREAELARLMAIKNHLDPHFIFNTLNAIAEWCRDDALVAEQAILQLSQLLRLVLTGVNASSWPLQQELQIIAALLDLYLLRDPHMFVRDVQIASDVGEIQVPPLLLLPLVENAIKHGAAKGHRGALKLSITLQEQSLVVVVENAGPYAGERVGGEGLAMVRARLALFSDDRGMLHLVPCDDGTAPRTRATLVLPRTGLPQNTAQAGG